MNPYVCFYYKGYFMTTFLRWRLGYLFPIIIVTLKTFTKVIQ